MAKDNRTTVLYERLSRDDEMQGESHSITNQKKYLEDYAVQHCFGNIQHFSDDGYSGTNFNRPAFNSLLTEIEAGRVGTVIVKDTSRFGRNYLQVGFYTEMMLPKKNVRFIAVNNGVDSANPAYNDFTPFLNIMNEWYAKDTSKKSRQCSRQKCETENVSAVQCLMAITESLRISRHCMLMKFLLRLSDAFFSLLVMEWVQPQ